MKKYIERCKGLIQSRGLLGFFKFLLHSIVRKSEDIVFDKDLRVDDEILIFELEKSYTIHIVNKNNVNDMEMAWLCQMALAGENSMYRDGLECEDCLVAVTRNKELVHTSFIQFKTSYKVVLDENGEVPLIGNCWTSTNCRGQGLYPYAIIRCCKEMALKGCDRIIISCSPDNFASIAGIEKTGFKRARNVFSYLILTKILIQRLTVRGSSTFRVRML